MGYKLFESMPYVFLICVVLTISIILFYRLGTKRIINKLDEMLDKAINGTFTESTYDESKLSALETKLNRYLSICTVSSKNLAQEKEKIKTLISDISHQTKTPLANILLYSQILLENSHEDEISDPSEQMKRDCIKQICGQTEKLNFLITSLIKTSRLETGIITVNTEQDSIDEVIKTSLADIYPKAAAKNIELIWNPTGGRACFDRKWTAEAVFNILDNAVKYTGEGGTITISSIAYDLFYRIDIKDTGIGITEEEISKIFGRFYRSPAVNKEEGVGIGLYLAREIISAQGGYIKVKSRPGKGSVFSIFLPKDS